MNLKRKTIARVCLASLVGLAPATPALATQVLSPTSKAVPDATPTHSILEPIPAAASNNGRGVQSAGQRQHTESPADLTVKAAGSGLSIFQQVDAIAVAAATPENSLVPVGYELDDAEEQPLLVGLANIDPGNASGESTTQPLLADDDLSSNVGAGLASSTAEAILVHPPTSRPSAPNRHYVRIENSSDVPVTNVIVELNVAANARVMEVMPYDTEVIGRNVRYRLRRIEAGQSAIVELTTTPDSPIELAFDSRYSMDPLQRIARRPTPATTKTPRMEKASFRKAAAPDSKAPASPEPAKTPTADNKQAANGAQAPASEMEVTSGATARKTWQDDSRLSYGPTSIPGRVMVANPQSNASLPFPRTPSTALPQQENLQANDASTDQLRPDVESDAITPRSVASRTTPDGLKLTSQLRTRIEGPQHAVTGEEAEYEVIVENNSIKNAKDVIVQLAIPAGLEVTTLDRNAWFDGKARTITWKVPAVDAGDSETIRYLAKVTSPIGQLQKVTLGVENKFRGQATFQSTIMDQYELAAPLMSFEKDGKSLK